METNPYRQPGRGECPSSSGSGAKSRVVWFALGFIVSWAAWSAISYARKKPRDYIHSWPAEMRDLAPDWTKQAQGRKVGNFTVLASVDSEDASAMIYPSRPNHFPGVVFRDDNADHRIDSIFLVDAAHQTISLDVADGLFQSYAYSNGIATDAITFQDANLDGHYDYRFGLERGFAVMVGSEWYDVIDEDSKRYIELDGTRTPLNLVDGVWSISERKQ
jgi:hypothetical protein